MPRVWLVLLLAVVLLVLPRPGVAETRYVSDQLVIALRAQPDTAQPAIATLKTDTPLEVLAEQGKFLRVRTPEGREGYVLARYVTSQTPRSLEIARLQQERDALQKKLADLEAARQAAEDEAARAEGLPPGETAATLESRIAALEQDLAESRAKLQTVTRDYQALQKEAADVVNLASERQRLQTQNEKLLTEMDGLREENSALLRNGMIRWFLAGGGVFLVGWLAGKLSRKKRRSF